jgi:hypothetical protein
MILSFPYYFISLELKNSSYIFVKKGKAIPVTGREGPQGCEMLRLQHFLGNQLTIGGAAVSLTRQPPFTPPGRFLVLIFLEVESIPWSHRGWKG